MKLSLIVPCYNEAENVQAFQDAVIRAFNDCGYDYEIIFVDDGSTDKSRDIAMGYGNKYPNNILVFSTSKPLANTE